MKEKNNKKRISYKLIDMFMLEIYTSMYEVCDLNEYQKDMCLFNYSALLVL